MNYFAVDLGATSGRTILATDDGARVEMKEITHSGSGINWKRHLSQDPF